MPDMDPLLLLILRVALGLVYVSLLLGITRSWRAWLLFCFPFFPPEIQTLALACAIVWAIKAEKEAREKQTEEIKRTAGLFGPRPVP